MLKSYGRLQEQSFLIATQGDGCKGMPCVINETLMKMDDSNSHIFAPAHNTKLSIGRASLQGLEFLYFT